MVKKFPMLTMDGPNPWHFFNTKLSAKMRNTRNRRKKKVEHACESHSQPPRPKVSKLGVAQIKQSLPVLEIEDETNEEMVNKLKLEKTKNEPNMDLVLAWHRKTFEHRQSWIRNKPSTELKLSNIIKENPWLADTRVLEYECEMLSFSSQEFNEKFVILLEQVEKVTQSQMILIRIFIGILILCTHVMLQYMSNNS